MLYMLFVSTDMEVAVIKKFEQQSSWSILRRATKHHDLTAENAKKIKNDSAHFAISSVILSVIFFYFMHVSYPKYISHKGTKPLSANFLSKCFFFASLCL